LLHKSFFENYLITELNRGNSNSCHFQIDKDNIKLDLMLYLEFLEDVGRDKTFKSDRQTDRHTSLEYFYNHMQHSHEYKRIIIEDKSRSGPLTQLKSIYLKIISNERKIINY
jgi:hypothetical protein